MNLSATQTLLAIPSAWLERVSLAACLLLPWLLIVSRGGADAAGVVLGVLFLLHSWQTRNWAWTKTPVIRVCFFAWAWMLCITSPFATDISDSFSSALPWIRWILLYAALVFWVLTTHKRLRLCALNIAFMLCLVMIDTVWQYHFGVSLTGHVPNESYRLTGPMDNVKVGVFISKLAFPAAAILLFQAMEKRQRKQVWASALWLGACIATVMLSGERTAFFTCLLALGITTAIIVYTEPALRSKSLIALAVMLILSLVLLATQPVLQERLAYLSINIEHFKDSSYGQLDWVGYKLGTAYWATGAGMKAFRVLCLPFLESGQVTHCNLHPHNAFVEWFAELGVPGLLIFIGIVATLCSCALTAIKANSGAGRVLSAMVLATLAMHFFPIMVTQSFFSNWPALLLWYSISIATASLNMVKSSPEK